MVVFANAVEDNPFMAGAFHGLGEPECCINVGISGPGGINHKTTGVRVIPVVGKGVGEMAELGGLLGKSPILKVSPFSAGPFIRRGGRIPAPMSSLKN